MRRVPSLLDQSPRLVALFSRLSQAHLRILAQGKDVFLPVDLVAVAPILGAGGANFDEQTSLITELAGLIAGLGLADLDVCERHVWVSPSG
ncbi:hypothetical protein D9M70_631770 [compost metagenome]